MTNQPDDLKPSLPRGIPPVKHGLNPVHWVADFLRRERVRQNITQMELALRVGMANTSIGQFEVGANKLSIFYVVERILAELGYKLCIRKIKK